MSEMKVLILFDAIEAILIEKGICKPKIVSAASIGLLLAAPAGNSGMQMMGQGGQNKMSNNNPYCPHKMGKNKMAGKKQNSPFLIKFGLPHMTKMVMQHWDEPAFALTNEQKEQLLKVRKETMGAVIQIKPEVIALRNEIVSAGTSGASADSLKEKVEKLASLEANATMVQLRCIEKTKEILNKDQLLFLLSHRKNRMGMKPNNNM
ncbi:MAG: hypothetical protein IE885_08140 [Campylobacterales bacterium]|nr:hypothetical protein [Campylobacterales bacterium]